MSDSPSFRSRDAEGLLASVADVATAQLPLAEGLRAAATDANGRVRRGLEQLAAEVERGRTLDEACRDTSIALPPHLRGMLLAAVRTGQLGPALEELLQHQFRLRRLLWRISGSLIYPALVITLNFAVISFLLVWVVPTFSLMFDDFGIDLPTPTLAVLAMSEMMIWATTGDGRTGFFAVAVFVVVLAYFTVSGRGGAIVQRYFIESLPIFGVLWQWTGASGFLYLLGALLNKEVPLEEALRLAGAGCRKADLRQAGGWLADQVAAGQSLGDLVDTSGCLPASTVPLLKWGERNDTLPEAAFALSEMLQERVDLRTDWLRSVAPPFVYVLIGLSAGAIIVALFLPLVGLIQGLA